MASTRGKSKLWRNTRRRIGHRGNHGHPAPQRTWSSGLVPRLALQPAMVRADTKRRG